MTTETLFGPETDRDEFVAQVVERIDETTEDHMRLPITPICTLTLSFFAIC
jgi:hypothetical protein